MGGLPFDLLCNRIVININTLLWHYYSIINFLAKLSAVKSSEQNSIEFLRGNMFKRKNLYHNQILATISIFVSITLQGCETPSAGAGTESASAAPESSWITTDSIWKSGGCALGGVAGLLAAKALAASEAKKGRFSKAELAKRERSYMISFGLLGCGGGSVLSGSIYAKLSEAGRKEREKALVEAASQARPQRYGEPGNTSLKGAITPGKRYVELDTKRECMDVEDTLSDGSGKDSIFVKMCRNVPNGGWVPVTA